MLRRPDNTKGVPEDLVRKIKNTLITKEIAAAGADKLMPNSRVKISGDLIGLTNAFADEDGIDPNSTLNRVPSQKLSTIIHRRNKALRQERRAREKEMMKSHVDTKE